MQIEETNVLENKNSNNRADLTTLQSLPASSRGVSSPLASELAYWLTTPEQTEIATNVAASSSSSTTLVEQKPRKNGKTSTDLVNVPTSYLSGELLQPKETIANSIKKVALDQTSTVHDPTSLERLQHSQKEDSDDGKSIGLYNPISPRSEERICSYTLVDTISLESDSDDKESSVSDPIASDGLVLSKEENLNADKLTETQSLISINIEEGEQRIDSHNLALSTSTYAEAEGVIAQHPSTDLFLDTKEEIVVESVAEIEPQPIDIFSKPESAPLHFITAEQQELQVYDVNLLPQNEAEEPTVVIKCQDESEFSESSSAESDNSSDATSTSDQSDTVSSTSATQPTDSNTSDNETEIIANQADNFEQSEIYINLCPSRHPLRQENHFVENITNNIDSKDTPLNVNVIYQKGDSLCQEYKVNDPSSIERSNSALAPTHKKVLTTATLTDAIHGELALAAPNLSTLPLSYVPKYEFPVELVRFEEPTAPDQTLLALKDTTISEVEEPALFSIQTVESLAGFTSETLNGDAATAEQQGLQQEHLYWNHNGSDTQTATSFSEDFVAVPHLPSNLPTSIANNATESVAAAELKPSVQSTPFVEPSEATEQLNSEVVTQTAHTLGNAGPQIEKAIKFPEPPRLLPASVWPYLINQQKERVIHELSVYEKLLLQHENQLKYQQNLQSDGDQVDWDIKSLSEAEVFVWLQQLQTKNKSDINNLTGDQAVQMGIEKWFSTLRNLIFNRTTNTNDTTEDNTPLGSALKRRSVNLKSTEQYHPIKYRRVDNTFPKIINTPPASDLNDDDFMSNGVSYYPMSKQNFLPRHTIANNSESVSVNRSKLRNSFTAAATQNVRRSLQNQNVCEIDLSDDDDDYYSKIVEQNIRGHNVVKSGGAVANGCVDRKTAVNGDCLKPGKVYNVHVERTGVNERLAPPPPPLLMADGNDWLAAPYQQRVTHGNMNHTDYLRCSSSLSSQDTPTLGSGRTNNNWSLAPLRVVPQRREIYERAQYLRLLQQYEPRVYGGHEDELTQRRVSRRSNQVAKQHRVSEIGQPLGASNSCFGTLPPPPLSSTINLDNIDDEMPEVRKFVIEVDDCQDDDDDDIENVENVVQYTMAMADGARARKSDMMQNTSAQQQKRKQRAQDSNECVTTVDLVDDDFEDVIDLSGFDEQFDGKGAAKAEQPEQKPTSNANSLQIEPVNSMEARLQSCDLMKANWPSNFTQKWNRIYENKVQDVKYLEEQINLVAAEREKKSHEALTRRLKSIQFNDKPYINLDDLESDDEKQEKLMPLTAEHRNQLQKYINSPNSKILVSKFNLNITREDIVTLLGINWLNDEVINFYMNLLTERSEQKANALRVYAMNTFFVPRLLQGGHAAVRRWTRKVDIFSKDVIPVPVHVGGVHWCMAIINLKEKSIKYYDSMGKPNPGVLRALEMYLQEESLDKRKVPFDTSGFKIESVADSPRQSNGSDCGVFSCMTAEYVTRGRPITFSQDNMEYFRQKMILEIVGGKLWH